MPPFYRLLLVLLSLSLCTTAASAQRTTTIKHTYYTATFDTIQCSEIQGYYVQTRAHAKISNDPSKRIPRSNTFTNDPKQPTRCQLRYPSHYSTYNQKFDKTDLQHRLDKGHINPYSAFAFNQTAADESMYYSNVCPQISYFNEHQWEQLEMYIQKTVSPTYGDVQVWTGVLVSTAHPRKAGALFIPDYYWKLIAYTRNGRTVKEAWLGANKSANTSTDPDKIRTNIADLKRVIRQYYPKFAFEF